MMDRTQSSHPTVGYDSASDTGQQGWQEGLRQPMASTYLHHTTQMGPWCQGGARGPHSQDLLQGLPSASLWQPGPHLPRAG